MWRLQQNHPVRLHEHIHSWKASEQTHLIVLASKRFKSRFHIRLISEEEEEEEEVLEMSSAFDHIESWRMAVICEGQGVCV